MSNPFMKKMLCLEEFEITDFKQNDNDMGFYMEAKEEGLEMASNILQQITMDDHLRAAIFSGFATCYLDIF